MLRRGRRRLYVRSNDNRLGAPEQRRSWELEAVVEYESQMNADPLLVNALINDTSMVQAQIDSGCLFSGVIKEQLITKIQLPRIPISPRLLQTAEEVIINKLVVKEITYISLDLDGHTISKLWQYIVLHSTHEFIFGKRWLEDQDAVIHTKKQQLELRRTGDCISSVKY